jgi:hypothetical protein
MVIKKKDYFSDRVSETLSDMIYYFLDGIEQGYQLLGTDFVNTTTRGREWAKETLAEYRIVRGNSAAFEKVKKNAQPKRKEFDDYYEGHPDFNMHDEPGEDGRMETYGEYFDKVHAQHLKHPKTVWTIVEGEFGELVVIPGLHFVNRYLYFVSKEEWQNENEEYLWC